MTASGSQILSSSGSQADWRKSLWLYLWAAVAALSLAWGLLTALRPGHSQDFHSIYTWVQTWLRQGSSPYLLPDYIVANYPPHAIVALSPLALMPESWAAGLWACLNVALAPLIAYLAFRALRPGATKSDAVLPCVMFLAWAGLRTGISNGQFTLLVLAFGMLAFLFAEKRPWLGGIFLALALMKPHIGGAFLLWALFTKRWRMLPAAVVLMSAGLLLFSLRLMESPLESVRAFLSVLQHQFGRGAEAQGSVALRVVEVRPLIALFIHNEVWAGRIQQLLLLALLGCAGVAARMKSRLSRDELDAAVLQLCCLWMLMSVFHNPYDTILLLPLLMGLWIVSRTKEEARGHRTRQAAVWVLQLAMVLELPGLWWKLSKTYDLSSLSPLGVLLAHFDRLLVLGLFCYLCRRVWLARSARSESRGATEMLAAEPSTPNS